MPDKKPVASSHAGYQTQARAERIRSRDEVVSYVHDMLASLQIIAATHELEAVSHLIGAARIAAKEAQYTNRSAGLTSRRD